MQRLREPSESELRSAISYPKSLLPEPPTVEDPLEEQPGEEIVEVQEKDSYAKVVKEQPCVRDRDGCPHGAYSEVTAIRLRRDPRVR